MMVDSVTEQASFDDAMAMTVGEIIVTMGERMVPMSMLTGQIPDPDASGKGYPFLVVATLDPGLADALLRAADNYARRMGRKAARKGVRR